MDLEWSRPMPRDFALIVEDSPSQQQMFCSLARKAGLEPHLAASGQTAIECLRSHTEYLLVLMDMRMEGMDGLECTRQIRQLDGGPNRRVAIVGITAHDGGEAEEQCLEAGMDYFLRKPFGFADFDQLVQVVLERKDRLAAHVAD